jgi:copper chaperone CopZ
MKSLVIIKSTFLLLLLPVFLFAQTEKKKTEIVYIQTSAICDECKSTIEHAVKGLKGVKKANVNLTDKKVMVEFKTGKVSVSEIKVAISKAGYDADEVKADPAAYTDLPMCCKKESK